MKRKGKLIELQGKQSNSIIRVRDFNSLLSTTCNLEVKRNQGEYKRPEQCYQWSDLVNKFKASPVQKQQNGYCVQLCRKHLPRSTIKLVSINLCVALSLWSVLLFAPLSDCGQTGFSVHKIFQSRKYWWVAFPSQ